jgi:hypothetical protein
MGANLGGRRRICTGKYFLPGILGDTSFGGGACWGEGTHDRWGEGLPSRPAPLKQHPEGKDNNGLLYSFRKKYPLLFLTKNNHIFYHDYFKHQQNSKLWDSAD